MSKKLIIILALAMVGGGAGAGAFLALSSKPAPPAEETDTLPPPPKNEPAGLLEMETFLANITGVDGSERFAKLQLRIAISPDSVVSSIKSDELMMARMRDRVLTLLTSKTFEELSDPLGKEGFRGEIRMRLEPLLEKGEIREVLFSEFVVQ